MENEELTRSRVQRRMRQEALAAGDGTDTEHITRVAKYKAKRKKQRNKRILIKAFVAFMVLCILTLTGGVVYFRFLSKDRPELLLERLDEDQQISIVYDKNGEEIARLSGPEKRICITYNQIPEDLIDAYISIEDKRFYSHHGIDIQGTISAIISELTGKNNRGGSTITQQLIKNTFLSSERTYQRKAQEMVLAYELERKIDKDEILTYYMNKIFLGENNYGVEAASLDYFGKHVWELDLKECAAIAGMTQYPNGYNPRTNYERCMKRANIVLQEMLEDGKITYGQYQEAVAEEPVIAEEYFDTGLYGHTAFIDYTVKSIAKDMLQKEGTAVTPDTLDKMEFKVRTGGYRIYSTLDTQKQDEIQSIVANYPYRTPAVEASAVIIDHSTGEIVVMIPGREENDIMDGFNRAVDSKQAIGSTAKPIFVYAPYIEMGADTDTIVNDTRTPIQGWNTEQGYPNGEITNNYITLRYAVETSRNIAAARTLMENVGIENSYDFLVKMGVDGKHASLSPAGMGLGADGFTTLEIAGAYATLANDGVYIKPHSYRQVLDAKGNVALKPDIKGTRVFSSETAWMMTDVLETTATHGYAVNAKLDGITTAGKTGTHEDKVVAMAGYTHYYTCFLRLSTDDDSKIYESSYLNSSSLWKQVMTPMHVGLEDLPIQNKTFDELNIVWYGGEYRHWTDQYYSKYIYPQPVGPTEHQVCDEWGNCWSEWW